MISLLRYRFECLIVFIAIGSALSPDYSYSITQQDNLNHEREKVAMSRNYEPSPADTSK